MSYCCSFAGAAGGILIPPVTRLVPSDAAFGQPSHQLFWRGKTRQQAPSLLFSIHCSVDTRTHTPLQAAYWKPSFFETAWVAYAIAAGAAVLEAARLYDATSATLHDIPINTNTQSLRCNFYTEAAVATKMQLRS